MFWERKSYHWAGVFLDAWLKRAMRSRLGPIKKVARGIRSHQGLILNWFAAKKEFNTAALNAGVPLPLVRQRMGHSTRSMTEIHYTGGDAESLRFMANMPFDGLAVAVEAAKGGLSCESGRLVV